MANSIKSDFPNIGNKSVGSQGTSTEWNGIVQAIDDTQSKSDGKVDIGLGAVATRIRSVIIGNNATDIDRPESVSPSSGGMVAIGNEAHSAGWRCTALGEKSIASELSSTAIGYGAIAKKTHGNAFGRGSYCNVQNTTMIGSTGNINLYLANNQGMDFTPENGIDVGNRPNPESEETVIHGRDGKDWKDVPTFSNIKGGNISIASGAGTGTGIGGEVRFKTSPLSGAASNTINPKVDAGKFDSASSVDTRFLLLDVTTGTLKRVEFGADDSAGVGFKTLKVAN